MDNVLATYNNKTKDYKLFKYLIDSSKIKLLLIQKCLMNMGKIFGYKFDVLHNGVDRKVRKFN